MVKIGEESTELKTFRLYLQTVNDHKVTLKVNVNGKEYKIADFTEKYGKLDEMRHFGLPEDDFVVDIQGQIKLGL